MMETLQEIDVIIYMMINGIELPLFLESLMVTITMLNKNLAFLLYALPLILGFWVYKGGPKAAKCLLALIIVVGTTDFSANQLLKKGFKRRRPHRVKTIDSNLRLPYSPKGYSFVSNHSANMFSAAMVLTSYYPPYRVIYFAYAALVAFSRPYVGVHYPSDIFFGALTGMLIAWLFLKLWLRRHRWFEVPEVMSQHSEEEA